MSKDGTKDLIVKFKDTNREISILKKKLNEINDQKEEWFKRKEDLKKDVLKLIKTIRELKARKNKFNDKVKELKKEREKYNNIVKENVEEIKKINSEKSGLLKKFDFKENPVEIKQRMERLELQIETEILSLGKEKKLMKEIKKLKKQLKEMKDVGVVAGEGEKVSKNIDEAKRKAEELHLKVQVTAKESQKDYEKFLELSKKVKELNKKQEEAFEKFLKLKESFTEVTKGLEEKLQEASSFKKELDLSKLDKDERKKLKINEILKLQEEEVEEKLRLKKKLTKDDLLKLQKI